MPVPWQQVAVAAVCLVIMYRVPVDTEHHLIVAHEVTNVGHDRSALHDMSEKAKDVIGGKTLDVVADRGYYNGSEIFHPQKL